MAKQEKINWEQFDRGVFLVIILGIIFDPKERKILIGKRKQDPHIKELGWCFLGGRPEYGEDLEQGLKREIKKEIGLNVESLGTVFAKAYPEKKEFLSVYNLCEVISGTAKPGKKFTELKWVDPEELEKYFTTSFHPRLKEYIINLK